MLPPRAKTELSSAGAMMAAMTPSPSNARNYFYAAQIGIPVVQLAMEIRARTLRNAIGSAICQQVIVVCLALMILDGGAIADACLFAVVAFWIGVAIIQR